MEERIGREYVTLDERYYPAESLRKELELYGIRRNQQDFFSLLALLPRRFFHDNIRYYFEITSYPVYTVKYVDENGIKYADRNGEKLADAVAGMVIFLSQKKVIPS